MGRLYYMTDIIYPIASLLLTYPSPELPSPRAYYDQHSEHYGSPCDKHELLN